MWKRLDVLNRPGDGPRRGHDRRPVRSKLRYAANCARRSWQRATNTRCAQQRADRIQAISARCARLTYRERLCARLDRTRACYGGKIRGGEGGMRTLESPIGSVRCRFSIAIAAILAVAHCPPLPRDSRASPLRRDAPDRPPFAAGHVADRRKARVHVFHPLDLVRVASPVTARSASSRRCGHTLPGERLGIFNLYSADFCPGAAANVLQSRLRHVGVRRPAGASGATGFSAPWPRFISIPRGSTFEGAGNRTRCIV